MKSPAVVLRGRLGNQLFQYAVARAYTPPDEAVAVYDVITNADQLFDTLTPESVRRLGRGEAVRLRVPPTTSIRYVRGLVRDLDDALARSKHWKSLWRTSVLEGDFEPGGQLPRGGPSHVLLRGFFQLEEFFCSARDSIGESFRPPSPVVSDIVESRFAESGLPTVAVVIRAGPDYDFLGRTLPASWYERATASVRNDIGPIETVVFSDINTVRELAVPLLSEFGPSWAPSGLGVVDQLNLIAACDHAVIGPSSFAWWGAWLGEFRGTLNSERLIVAPDPWVDPIYTSTVPGRWRRLAI